MNLYQKLVEVKKHVEYLKKESKGFQYNYVGSSQVLGSLRDKMNELNLLLVPSVTRTNVVADTIETTDKNGQPKHTATYFTEVWMDMTWINADQPDERETSPWYAQGIDTAGEKGPGKAYTYAEKYFLLKFFNIPTDQDDPDAFQSKHTPPAQQDATPEQKKAINAAVSKTGIAKDAYVELVTKTIGHNNYTHLTREEATKVLTALTQYKKEGEQSA